MPQIFTLDEANALLPRLRAIMIELQEKKPAFDNLRPGMEEMARSAAVNCHSRSADTRGERRRGA